MKRFSIIIPTYNRVKAVLHCMSAIINQSYPAHEIIVVDDGSTDETAVMVEKNFPSVTLLQHTKNQGPAAARNRGIKVATGEIIVFTDDDCRPPKDWLAQLSAGIEKYPYAGAIGGIQLPPLSIQKKSIFARYEAFVTYHVYRVGQQVVIGQPAPGGTNNLAIPKKILDEVGYFDTRFPSAAGEDADLLHRIAAAGYQTVCLTTAVSHHPTYTLLNFIKQQQRRGEGAAYFSQKYGQQQPLAYELVKLFLSPLLFIRNVWKFRQPVNAWLHTLAGFLQTLGRIIGRKNQTQAPTYAWKSSASPTKLNYLQRFAVGKTALDVGSGIGFYCNWLSKRDFFVTAVDKYPNPATQNNRYLVQGDLTALPFQQQFDTILCFDVIEHVADDIAALKELHRLAGKRLLLSVPNQNDKLLHQYNLTYKHHVDKTHYREYQLSDLEKKLSVSGFHIIYSHLEGPVNPSLFADFIQPTWIQPYFRAVIKILFKVGFLQNQTLMADLYVVAEPIHPYGSLK